jgi:hypothetical protein
MKGEIFTDPHAVPAILTTINGKHLHLPSASGEAKEAVQGSGKSQNTKALTYSAGYVHDQKEKDYQTRNRSKNP